MPISEYSFEQRLIYMYIGRGTKTMASLVQRETLTFINTKGPEENVDYELITIIIFVVQLLHKKHTTFHLTGITNALLTSFYIMNRIVLILHGKDIMFLSVRCSVNLILTSSVICCPFLLFSFCCTLISIEFSSY